MVIAICLVVQEPYLQLICGRTATQSHFYTIFYKYYHPQFPDEELRLKFQFVIFTLECVQLMPLRMTLAPFW